MVGVCGGTSSDVDVGVVRGVAVVLVWCWYSGVGVGGAVVLCGVWWEVETYQTSRNPFFLGGGELLPKF